MYVRSNTLLLADVFENFKNMCLEIYELDPAKFLSVPGLAWQAALKKTKLKLDLLTVNRYRYVINGIKGIRGGIYHLKEYNKNKE